MTTVYINGVPVPGVRSVHLTRPDIDPHLDELAYPDWRQRALTFSVQIRDAGLLALLFGLRRLPVPVKPSARRRYQRRR